MYSMLLKKIKSEIIFRKIQVASIIIARRFVRFTKGALRQQGPTQEFRMNNQTRYATTVKTALISATCEDRAKAIFAGFLSKVSQLLAFKRMTYEFLIQIYHISSQMNGRLKQHRLKMQHLDLLFERELFAMKSDAFSNFKKKRNQILIAKYQNIRPEHKAALLQEYFNMCKMVYRIRNATAYSWDIG